jgi:hypothetical protein
MTGALTLPTRPDASRSPPCVTQCATKPQTAAANLRSRIATSSAPLHRGPRCLPYASAGRWRIAEIAGEIKGASGGAGR